MAEQLLLILIGFVCQTKGLRGR